MGEKPAETNHGSIRGLIRIFVAIDLPAEIKDEIYNIQAQFKRLDIFCNEMANPTGLLAGAVQQSIEPIFRGFADNIRELLGKQSDEKQVRLCLMSIRAQCFGPLMRERQRKMTSPDPLPTSSEWNLDDLETLVDHVTRFSMAGVREIKRYMEASIITIQQA